MSRTRVLLTSAVGVAVVIAAAAPAAPAATPSCKGRSLNEGGLIKVVDRGTGPRAHRYAACARRDASVARRLRGTRPGAKLEVLSSRGAMLAVRDVGSGAVTVWNVAGPDRVRLRRGGRDPVGRVVVAEAGEAAALFGTGSRRALVGFDYDGTAYTIDAGAIPLRSLRRGKGSRVGWSRDGRRRSADLSEPELPCARLAGRAVERSDELNVVSFTYESEFLEGELDGVTRRTRGCVLPRGRIRVLGSDTYGAGTGVQGGSGFSVLDVAGTFVAERQATADSEAAATSETYAVRDLLSGRRVVFFGTDTGDPNAELGTISGDVVLSARGDAASVFADGGERVVAFDPAGRPRVLDSAADETRIDETSLAITGTVLSWTRDAERRSAELEAP